MRRRAMVMGLPAAALAGKVAPPMQRGLAPRTFVFPRDHGAHAELRTEWWYLTGHGVNQDRLFGFQVTFFRSRVDATQALESRFAARQLVFAHAAVTDVRDGKLLHDQRIAREGFDIAAASQDDTRIHVRDWSLIRDSGSYRARMNASGFSLSLNCAITQPVLLQGRAGLSRKGPAAEQASYYYSQPQLDVAGTLSLGNQPFTVAGKAWLDHEWSEALLHPMAVGWDWIGMNLDDGSALTAFRLRRADGSTLWSGGSFRARGGSSRNFADGEVGFEAQRLWTSPMSRARYPVQWQVGTPVDMYTVKALVDDQELDSRASTGAIYWEGLSDLFDSAGRKVGRGYLEMTGYTQRLRL